MEGRKVDDPGSQGVDRAGVSSELVGFTVLSSSLQEVELVLRTESSGQVVVEPHSRVLSQ